MYPPFLPVHCFAARFILFRVLGIVHIPERDIGCRVESPPRCVRRPSRQEAGPSLFVTDSGDAGGAATACVLLCFRAQKRLHPPREACFFVRQSAGTTAHGPLRSRCIIWGHPFPPSVHGFCPASTGVANLEELLDSCARFSCTSPVFRVRIPGLFSVQGAGCSGFSSPVRFK